MLEPEKPKDQDSGSNLKPKDEKPGMGQGQAPDQQGLEPKSPPKE